MSRFLARVAAGVPLTFLGLVVFLGGLQEAAGFLLMSIVCTAGISLVVLLPAFWVVGFLTLELVRLFGKRGREDTEAPAKRAPVDRQVTAVVAYMRKALAYGIDREEIARRLAGNGWTEAMIQKGWESLEEMPLA